MKKVSWKLLLHKGYHTNFQSPPYVLSIRSNHPLSLELVPKSGLAHGLKALENFSRRLDLLTVNVDRIDKAIDEMLYYSYQYNLKIVGVPLISESESAQDIAELCVKLFSGLGVNVSIWEIDIAHRVPQRDTSTGNGNRRQPNPLICKFTRRMTRDTVLASRGNASRLTTEDLDLPSTAEINRIAIYSHLKPRLQELLHSAKAHQNTYNYKWC